MTLKHDIYRFWADFGPSGAFGDAEKFSAMSPRLGGPIPNFGLKMGPFLTKKNSRGLGKVLGMPPTVSKKKRMLAFAIQCQMEAFRLPSGCVRYTS